MKNLLLATIALLSISHAQANFSRLKTCSLKDGISSDCYFKRTEAKLRANIIYYGNNYWQDSDLQRFSTLFSERFKRATKGELEIEIVKSKVMNFAHPLPINYAYNGITDPDRLHRIWYWENFSTAVGMEIHKLYRKSEIKKDLENIDLLLVVTGAQSDGNGFAAGRVVVVEQPREVAWGLPGGGSTEELSDYELADIMIHEVGHAIGIGHATEHCTETGLSPSERRACCANSPSGNDVMSYCRDRKATDENRINGFEACTLDIIKNKIKPRILAGGKRRILEPTRCK
jgi:hypothetical protein